MSEQTEAQARAEATRAYREYIAPVMRKAAERYMYRLERLRDEVARMYEREERYE